MIDAIAVQLGQAGAAPRHSPLSPATLRPPISEPALDARNELYRNSTTLNPTQHGRASSRSGIEAPQVFQKPGTVDKQGLLNAQAEESEAERERRKDPEGLTEEERAIVKELQARDREVRAHEQAHARVGGQYAGNPTYQFETGPDGKRYAVSGQVKIDVSPVRGNPEATIRKMEQVKKAALAPAEPSAQDRAVASKADAVKAKARAELAQQRAQEQREAREERAEETEEGQSGASTRTEEEPYKTEKTSLDTVNFDIAGTGLTDPQARTTDLADPRSSGRRDTVSHDESDFRSDRPHVAAALAAYRSGQNSSITPRGFSGAADATHVLNLVT